MSAAATLDLMQRVGAPLARAIDGGGTGVLLSAGQPGGILSLLMQGCAFEGRAHLIEIGEHRLAATDGLRPHVSRDGPGEALRQMTSLDRLGLQAVRVVAVALGDGATGAGALRGASALIARDRPLFLVPGEAAPLAELGASYAVRHYARLDGAAGVSIAVPRERVAELTGGLTP